MAAGTWNQGDLEKRVTKIDLENYPTIEFRDTSLTSDQIFDVIDFPNRLTAGKNLIKLRASNQILIKDSKIHIEILDSNGDPIYYEPLNYLEHDGTRVIAIYIFPEKTAPGVGTIYLASRTKVNLNNGQRIPFSKDYNNPNYINHPNVLWSRKISIAPENSKNNTEIIFTKPHPKATVRERVNKYFEPINLTDVAVDRNGSGTVTLTAIPSTTPTRKSVKSIGAAVKTKQTNYEGAASPRTPMKSVGKQVSIKPKIKEFKKTPADIAANKPGQPIEVENAEIVTVSTFSRLETNGFALTSSMEGGTITIVNPHANLLQGNSLIDQNGHLIPSSQVMTDRSAVTSYELGDPAIQLSGSYTFVIDKILSTTKANVFLQSGFKNDEENTFGAFVFTAQGIDGEYDVKNINATSNFTCSYIEPFVLSETEQSQSFAEIILSNIEPATGDVFKIQTLYKASGQFGDFIDAGYVNVEQIEILEDVTSFESIQSIGMVYNRIGYFTSLTDFQSYWETTNGSVTPEVALTPTYNPDILLDGIQLTPGSTFNATSNRFGYLHLKSEYHPTVYQDTRYMLTLNAVVEDIVSSDDNIQYPRLDIYISGSESSIKPNVGSINQYVVSDITIDEISNFGTRISTIELKPGTSFDETPALISFKALKKENIDVYFMIRRGKWTLSNISLKSDKQTGFSPNYTRINTRIPSEFLNTPLTFKFLYYDINNNRAQAETSVFPVTFRGDNLVISGENNLLSGSVYIGNTVGSGIELAGVNSGFIRSIGYEGFLSASRTDQPGGFMLYTGSVLPNAPDNYAGVGIEIVQDSSSYFKFDTTDGIDVRAKKFFIGTEETQFVSGSSGNIEISSSNFHLKPDGGLIIGGDTVIDADLSVNNLFVPASSTHNTARAYISSSGDAKFAGDGAGAYKAVFEKDGTATISGFTIDTSEIKSSNNALRLKSSGDITASQAKFIGGDIGGFTLSSTALTGGTGANTVALTPGTGIHLGDASFGSAPFSVTKAGVLKALSGTIGGWSIGATELIGGSMVIRDDGTIESVGYASDVAGSGFRLTADNGGFLEVENAKIRGTLSTAVFEKEAVNAVGGQLYVANSSVLTGSVVAPGGVHSATTTTMSLENVSGFVAGEILTAKKVSDTGFQTEYIKVISQSRFDIQSDTNMAGFLFVERGYSGSVPQNSSSLGDIASAAQSYSGSQVIVSTGRIGTGYIRLNANPSDPYTPYIDIVERTGSAIYDIQLKARLGDLSGLSSVRLHGTNPSNAGFGLYSENVFLEGGIVARTGSIAGIEMDSGKLYTGNGVHDDENTGFYLDSSSKFSLGDQLVWDGTDLTVRGSITITNPAEQGFVTPAQTGSITDGFVSNDATSSLLTSDDTASLTQNSATSSLINPLTYQFGGDDGFTLGTHTVNTGLNLNSSFLGYFSGTTPKTFMSSSGDFFLGGTGGAFKWDESEGALLVSGSDVTLFTPSFYLGGANQYISGSNGNIEIKSNNFELSTAGAITATAGEIGGFGINATTISSSNNNLVLKSNGDLTASNADFDGFAIARSLRQKAVTINEDNMHLYIKVIKQEDDIPVTAGNGLDADGMVTYSARLVLDGSIGGEMISHVILDIDMFMEDPMSKSISQIGKIFVLGEGTEPTHYEHHIQEINEDGDIISDTTTGTGGTSSPAGAIRSITPPTVAGVNKVPVTIDVAHNRRVDFFIPTDELADNTAGFGSIFKAVSNHIALPTAANKVV